MEYAAIFLPLFGSILGYVSKYIGNIFPLLITTFFVFMSALFSILIFNDGIPYGQDSGKMVARRR